MLEVNIIDLYSSLDFTLLNLAFTTLPTFISKDMAIVNINTVLKSSFETSGYSLVILS